MLPYGDAVVCGEASNFSDSCLRGIENGLRVGRQTIFEVTVVNFFSFYMPSRVVTRHHRNGKSRLSSVCPINKHVVSRRSESQLSLIHVSVSHPNSTLVSRC